MNRRIITLLVALSLLLAACNGEAEPEAADTARPEPTRTPTAEPEAAEDVPEDVHAAPEAAAEPQPLPTEATLRSELPLAERVAEDPEELADQLTGIERRIRTDDVPDVEMAELGHLQQLIYRRLAEDPEEADAVVGAVGADVRTDVEQNLFAGARLRAMITEPATELPSWEIVEPAPADELLGHYRDAAEEFGIDWTYLASIHLVETRMGRIRGTSTAGAQGPMQFMPGTWEQYGGGGDVHDDRDAIFGAARYLRASGAPDDMDAALFAYNRDVRYVDALRTYAERMQDDERAYRAYYHWQVYYRTAEGDVLLPVGYRG